MTNLKTPLSGLGTMLSKHDKRARSIAMNALDYEKSVRTKGESPGPKLLQDIHKRSHYNDDTGTNIVDFIKKNLNVVKEQRNTDFDRAREVINKVHTRIKKRKDYSLDQRNLFHIQTCLNPKLKQHFISNQGFFQIFQETNVLNQAFLQIID